MPDGLAVVPNSFVPNAITCLSLGDTTIELTVVGELVTIAALTGLVDASASQ